MPPPHRLVILPNLKLHPDVEKEILEFLDAQWPKWWTAWGIATRIAVSPATPPYRSLGLYSQGGIEAIESFLGQAAELGLVKSRVDRWRGHENIYWTIDLPQEEAILRTLGKMGT